MFQKFLTPTASYSSPMESSSTVAGVLLLVPMSSTFVEPVSLRANHCNTDLNALQDESEMDAIENGKYIIKKHASRRNFINTKTFTTLEPPLKRSSTSSRQH